MLTRREKLLNRPWQIRRYNIHRHKVLNALPAIDFGPPTEHRHVTCKLKKQQWESERMQKIEEDNFKLLQRMGSIMKKNRLENHWKTSPPDFLHRVGIYHRTRSPTPYRELESTPNTTHGPVRRKSCSACTPNPTKAPVIPEERIPWSPPRECFSKQSRNSPAMQPLSDFNVKPLKKPPSAGALPTIFSGKRPESKRSAIVLKTPPGEPVSENRLVLTQGALKLSVNFPSHAEVKILSGNEEKFVQRTYCKCSAFKKYLSS